MFAPRVAIPAKSRSVPVQSSEAVITHGQRFQPNINGVSLAAQLASPTQGEPVARRAASWGDFSRIPLLAPDRAEQPQMSPHSKQFPAAWASCAVGGAMQMKLATDKMGDGCEREADRISAHVSATSPDTPTSGLPRPIQRVFGESTGQMDRAPSSVGRVLASPGNALEPALRQDMEQRFGHDFSRVRVHSGPVAEQSALDMHAHAYTVGHHMVFGAGRFAPGTREGRGLLAHELTHVAQQNGAMLLVQRAPAGDRRWTQDEAAARYRGRLMASRIRTHGVLSKEARAKINRELAYFEGSAKEAYLKEVRPALVAVTEIEMPAEQMIPRGPPPIRLSLLGEDPYPGSFKDEELYAPLKELEQKDEAELAQAREREIEDLRQRTKGWGGDQAFALDLLRPLLRYSVHVDPRAVSDAIRQPILSRYRNWLLAVDKERHKECEARPSGISGVIAESRAKFQNDDPCVSWFAEPYGHGPSELEDLERHLRLNRGGTVFGTPAELVYWDVFEYRKKTDPSMLEQYQSAAAMVGVLPALAGAGPSGTVPPIVTAEEETAVSGTLSRPVTGFGREGEPATAVPSAPVRTDVPTPLSRPVTGFGRVGEPATAVPSAPVRTDVPTPLSRPVTGFGREDVPSPPRGPAPQEPPVMSQMPPARMPSSSSGQGAVGDAPRVATGQRRDQPATAMADKPPGGDKPKIEPPKTSGGIKGPQANVGVAAENLDRIKRLKEWNKKGRVEGDVYGLEKRLRSNDPVTLKDAEDQFDEADARMAKGERVELEDPYEDPRHETPKTERISTGGKKRIDFNGWIRERLPHGNDQWEYRNWLKTSHKMGSIEHEHPAPGSPEAEELVRTWEREMGRRR